MGAISWALSGVALSLLAFVGLTLGRTQGRKHYSNGGLALLLGSMICIALASLSHRLSVGFGSSGARQPRRARRRPRLIALCTGRDGR